MALVALINLYKRQKLQLGLFQPDVQIALIALISLDNSKKLYFMSTTYYSKKNMGFQNV